ncbi:MAG TPA: sodium/solute symporter [Cytophagaceae bacterium]|jgi:cation/acetate symporter
MILLDTFTSTLGTANFLSIGMFLFFVFITMLITYWAARKTKTTSEFYSAGRSITGFQNGLALAGDYMSAASFLGIAGMVALKGYDGLIYSIGFLVGWPLIMFLVAEPLRNLGKYTFADVVAFRLQQRPIRIAAAIGSLTTIIFYLIAQMVGAGNLISKIFGLDYSMAVLVVGIVMSAYVLFGGMLATTWVQIIKAILLLGGATLIVIMTLSRFHYNPVELFEAAADKYSISMLSPGSYISNPFDALSLGLALMLGTAGLPHILMRFYTVPDAKAARKSVFVATGFIGYFYILTFIIGFGAMVLVGQDVISGTVGSYGDKGGNMAALLLAEVTGGTAFLGFIAAVAFATILAVVAGLTLSGASTISHDLYVNVFKKGVSNEQGEVKVARYATIGLGVLSIILGLMFQGQNVAFMVGLAFAIAASANFPALIMSILWKRFTTKGAYVSIITGAVSAIVLIIFSPTVWVDIFKYEEAIFPLKNPALISLPLAFLAGILVSLSSREIDAEIKFEKEKIRTYLGVGAE